MNNSIQFKGIQRAIPQSQMPDGACHEIINLRPIKGAFRPVGSKLGAFNYPVDLSAFSRVFVHDIEGGLYSGYPNWIGLKVNGAKTELWLIDHVNQANSKLLHDDLDTSITVNVNFLKRTMLVTSGAGVLVFMWTTEKTYVKLANLPVPSVDLIKGSDEYYGVEADGFHSAEAVLGAFYENLNKASQKDNGKFYGSMMYIAVYKMFDGSYIKPAIPKYLELNNSGELRWTNPGGGHTDDSLFWLKFKVCGLSCSIINDTYNSSEFEPMKDLISSVSVFATKITPLHQIDDVYMNDTRLHGTFGTSANSSAHKDTFPFKEVFPSVSDDFKDLTKSTGWYLVHEFDFEDIVGKTGKTTKELNLNNYYQDYATRETLTTDQNTHHNIHAKYQYIYNDRLHLLNVKTVLGTPYINWPVSTSGMAITGVQEGKISVWVKTSLGKVVIQSNINIPSYRSASPFLNSYSTQAEAETALAALDSNPNYIDGTGIINENYEITNSFYGDYTVTYVLEWMEYNTGESSSYYVIPSIVGYNDSRAVKMQIAVNTGGGYKTVFEQNLTKNDAINFAFYVNPQFSQDQASANANYQSFQVKQSTITAEAILPDIIDSIFDTNRLQVSEIQNPLIFPAKNSYQIGTGDGLAMASGSEPLSSGQFGQFPLQVFTTKGIWTMEVGTGDVLYPSIVPLAPEVINNAMNVIPSPFGVVYTTDKGLFMINGRQIAQLSEIIEDHNDTSMMDYVTEKTEVQTLISDSKFTDSLTNSLSSVNFLDYIENSTVGYDHINKELIVTNYAHSYSYVYSFESQAWYKLSHSYRLLVNNYPYLYAVTSDNTVSISHESKSGYVNCLIITAAQSLQNSDNFKKIERLILRTIFTSESGNYPGFYVFGSNDLKTWQFLQGKQRTGEHVKDLLNQRSHGSAKYYIFIFAGKITTDSEIKQIDIVYKNKWDNRLR